MTVLSAWWDMSLKPFTWWWLTKSLAILLSFLLPTKYLTLQFVSIQSQLLRTFYESHSLVNVLLSQPSECLCWTLCCKTRSGVISVRCAYAAKLHFVSVLSERNESSNWTTTIIVQPKNHTRVHGPRLHQQSDRSSIAVHLVRPLCGAYPLKLPSDRYTCRRTGEHATKLYCRPMRLPAVRCISEFLSCPQHLFPPLLHALLSFTFTWYRVELVRLKNHQCERCFGRDEHRLTSRLLLVSLIILWTRRRFMDRWIGAPAADTDWRGQRMGMRMRTGETL